jgi:thiol-disulfide isomerase/thioredoxin
MLCSLMLLATGLAAQIKPALTDDLYEEKTAMLGSYLPADQNGLSTLAFQMKPAEFLAKLERFKQAAYQKATTGKAAVDKLLYIGDIDAFVVLLTDIYRSNYGIDSAKQAYYYSLISREASDTVSRKQIETADRARFTKNLSAADSLKLDRLVNKTMMFDNAVLFKRSAFFRRIMDSRIRNILYRNYEKQLEAGENESLLKITIVKNMSNSQFIRDYYANDVMESLMNMTKDSNQVKKVYDIVVPQVKEAYYLAHIKKTYKNFVTYADGNTAPNFTYKDVDGKEVSLTDLRGKYVYIDLWATWCGPCKAEIPYLTRIEEDFKDKAVHFVSISLDKVANYAQWKSYVTSNKLKGIQLMVDKDFKSEFIESFNISFIPRFILIDPNGKIKDSNAKRPSDPELVKQLQQLLAAIEK